MSILFKKQCPNLDTATAIASHGFIQPISNALRNDVDNHLRHGQMVYTITESETGEVCGFVIFKEFDSILYLSGIILVPRFQGRGIACLAVDVARKETDSQYLALRTQSIRMWSSGEKMTSTWLPNPYSQSHDDLCRLGEYAATRTGSVYPLTRGIYGGGPLYGVKPTHHNKELVMWWDLMCNFERGDAVFCIGRF